MASDSLFTDELLNEINSLQNLPGSELEPEPEPEPEHEPESADYTLAAMPLTDIAIDVSRDEISRILRDNDTRLSEFCMAITGSMKQATQQLSDALITGMQAIGEHVIKKNRECVEQLEQKINTMQASMEQIMTNQANKLSKQNVELMAVIIKHFKLVACVLERDAENERMLCVKREWSQIASDIPILQEKKDTQGLAREWGRVVVLSFRALLATYQRLTGDLNQNSPLTEGTLTTRLGEIGFAAIETRNYAANGSGSHNVLREVPFVSRDSKQEIRCASVNTLAKLGFKSPGKFYSLDLGAFYGMVHDLDEQLERRAINTARLFSDRSAEMMRKFEKNVALDNKIEKPKKKFVDEDDNSEEEVQERPKKRKSKSKSKSSSKKQKHREPAPVEEDIEQSEEEIEEEEEEEEEQEIGVRKPVEKNDDEKFENDLAYVLYYMLEHFGGVILSFVNKEKLNLALSYAFLMQRDTADEALYNVYAYINMKAVSGLLFAILNQTQNTPAYTKRIIKEFSFNCIEGANTVSRLSTMPARVSAHRYVRFIAGQETPLLDTYSLKEDHIEFIEIDASTLFKWYHQARRQFKGIISGLIMRKAAVLKSSIDLLFRQQPVEVAALRQKCSKQLINEHILKQANK